MLKNSTAAFTLVLFILLNVWLAVAAEQKLLEDITFETPSKNEERVIFKLNGIYIPKIFGIKGENPRVVFDFPDIKPARLLKNTINTNGKFIKRIRMGVHYEPIPKTRVVFDLLPDKKVDFKHDFDTNKKNLIISVFHAGEEPDSRPAVREEKTVAPAPQKTGTQQPEPKLSDTQPDAQHEKAQAPAPEAKTPVPSPAPALPAVEQKKASTISPTHSTPALTAAQPAWKEVAPAPQKPETLPAAQHKEEQTSAAGPKKTSATSPAPELPAVEQEKTPIIPLTHSVPVLPVAQPSWEEVAPEPLPATQQEKKQTPISAETPETDKPSGPPVINSITFDKSSDQGEMVLFKLNKFQPPNVFGVEEGLPRVVCDFNGAEAADDVPNSIKTDGKYVHTIRIGRKNTPKKVRVVLDLTSNKNYDLQQIFFKDDNLFVIIINSRSNMPATGKLKIPLK